MIMNIVTSHVLGGIVKIVHDRSNGSFIAARECDVHHVYGMIVKKQLKETE
jgi:hypothetical protein